MIITRKCSVCRLEFEDMERVIFSAKETFVFKPAHVEDVPVTRKNAQGHDIQVSAAAALSPDELAESRKEHLRTAIVNTFVDWGRAEIPEGAFNFRHQWCEPQRTGASGSLHPVNKHAIRHSRAQPRRMNG